MNLPCGTPLALFSKSGCEGKIDYALFAAHLRACPACRRLYEICLHTQLRGAGGVSTPKSAAASRANGKLGGRPPKPKT